MDDFPHSYIYLYNILYNIFSQVLIVSGLFGGNNRPYSYDLAEVGRYYRTYAVMMATHWRDVLPSGVMLELNCEKSKENVHLRINVDPRFGIHRLVKLGKGRFSKGLRQEFREYHRRLISG